MYGNCPYCDSDAIQYNGVDDTGWELCDSYYCESCQNSWDENCLDAPEEFEVVDLWEVSGGRQ